jgi:S-adenosylmethionine:tRNA ribosyltransferase-isomerase
MPTDASAFDYVLPPGFIAQTPAVPRESANLMILGRTDGSVRHQKVADLPDFFRAGDVIVINNTRVFHARLRATVNTKSVELFLVRPHGNDAWLALGKPGKKFTVQSTVTVAPDFSGTVIGKNPDGTFLITFNRNPHDVIEKANTYGEVPVPPYIKILPEESDYQTVYAKFEGSVAAPTAGFHLTKTILSILKDKGVTILEITLHVGLGTFMPMKSGTIEEHTMHSEWVNISDEVAAVINEAKIHKQRVIAVGTTTVRTLEGVTALHNGKLQGYQGDINLFIKPGFHFEIIDAMLTNFHLPKSTLIVLVSAFAGRENIRRAYQEAVRNKYRFYSFGDAMLII